MSASTLVLRLDAPMMSFGGVTVDSRHPTLRYPIRSMLAGLLGNALGLDRTETDALTALQDSFEYASRWDVEPSPFRDYQNVDLGSVKMSRPAWKSDGTLAKRAGSDPTGTHQTERHYWSNGVLTCVVQFRDAREAHRIGCALYRPARPLFLGRKTCMAAAPIFRGTVDAEQVLAALCAVPVSTQEAMRRGLAESEGTVSLEFDLPDRLAGLLGDKISRVSDVPGRLDAFSRVHLGQERRLQAVFEVPVALALPLNYEEFAA